MDKDGAASDTPESDDGTPPCLRRNRELFRHLLTTFQAMLPAEKAARLGPIAHKLDLAVEDNCRACRAEMSPDHGAATPDRRRRRFLLRLVVSRLAPLFSGKSAIMPRSLIEGIDRYLNKAFGQMIYDDLNEEANQILHDLNTDNDDQMWEAIRKNPQWRRFVDTIFIRILLRFENFSLGKKTFINILNFTMQEQSHFTFGEEQFHMVFEALFADSWRDLQDEEQRLRWDFLFGDGAAKRLEAILNQGLAHWLKRKDNKVLASGRIINETAAAAKRK